MKLLLKEVEKNIKKRKKDRKEKKSKKNKKEKKKHHSSKRSNSSSSSSSRSRSKDNSKFKTPSNFGELRITTPSVISKNLSTNSNFGLIDKKGNKIVGNSSIRSLGPDESLYKERMKMLEKESELRKKNDSVKVGSLTQEEKERRADEMMKKAHILDYQRNLQIEEKNLRNKHDEKIHSSNKKPEFIKNIEKDTYLEGKILMSDRVKRNASTNIKLEKFD